MAKKEKKTSKKKGVDFTSITTRIKKLEALPDKISMVSYGRPGTGKTSFAATMPKPLLILDAKEEGTDSILGTEDTYVLPIETWEDFELAFWFLKSKEGRKYNSVSIDTFTYIQELCMNSILEETGRTTPSKREWGMMSNKIKPWILHYRDLPQHLMFICHDRVDEVDVAEDEDQIMPEVGPRLSPSISSALNAAVKVVGQSYIKEDVKTKKGKITKSMEYRFRIGPNPYYTTKIRCRKDFPRPNSLHNPTFQDIVDIMSGNYKPPVKVKKSAKKATKKKGEN